MTIKQENIGFIEIAMSYPEIVEEVQRVADQMWYKLPDVTSYEQTAYVACGKELSKDDGKKRNPLQVARHYAGRAARRHIKRTKYEVPTYISSMNKNDDSEDDREFDPEDDALASVVDRIIESEEIKNTVDLLAQDDRKRKLVLTAWLEGVTEATEIAGMLQHTFGGNSASQRVFVQRFKTSCRQTLEALAF